MTDNSTSSVDWQPIETAPRDGTWVLLWGAEPNNDFVTSPAVVAGIWSDYLNGGTTKPRWMSYFADGGYMGKCGDPTHWAPLPKGPADV